MVETGELIKIRNNFHNKLQDILFEFVRGSFFLDLGVLKSLKISKVNIFHGLTEFERGEKCIRGVFLGGWGVKQFEHFTSQFNPREKILCYIFLLVSCFFWREEGEKNVKFIFFLIFIKLEKFFFLYLDG